MYGRWKTLLASGAACLFSVQAASGQTVERIIGNIDGHHILARPVQLALSPTGGSVAACDQNGNRIYVFDTDGELRWVAGDAARIDQPTAVCFDGSDDALLFTEKRKRVVFRVSRDTPDVIDTVADLTDSLSEAKGIDQLVAMPEGIHLALDAARGTVYRFKNNWQLDRVLIGHGRGKGRLWSPVSVATDMSRNIIVASGADLPVQTFSPDGGFLFIGAWNAPQQDPPWEASAVCVTDQETVWVSDITNTQWRVYDRAGSELDRLPFVAPLFRPLAVVAIPVGRIFVADERGTIIIMTLP